MYGQDSSLVLTKKSDLAILVECQCEIFLAGSLIVGGIISLSLSLSPSPQPSVLCERAAGADGGSDGEEGNT